MISRYLGPRPDLGGNADAAGLGFRFCGFGYQLAVFVEHQSLEPVTSGERPATLFFLATDFGIQKGLALGQADLLGFCRRLVLLEAVELVLALTQLLLHERLQLVLGAACDRDEFVEAA